jgi:hypothetical protein
MLYPDEAASLLYLEQVATEQGIPLQNEIKGNYLNWKGD